jgi:uncharacterized protein
MSELINNARRRKDLMKHMILQLHEGVAPDAVRPQLIRLLGSVPYGEVVEVEQELIAEGLPVSEVLKLCDVHTAALNGAISQEGAKEAPEGHPVHTFRQENRALTWEVDQLNGLYEGLDTLPEDLDAATPLGSARVRFHALMDVDKHYRRKENLLFPHLEKRGISGPPTVMWGKHDEARALLKGAVEALEAAAGATVGEARVLRDLVLKPASDAVAGMVDKEEQILLPMCLDTLTEAEWGDIARQETEIGFCLYDPPVEWRPAGAPEAVPAVAMDEGRIHLPSGSFTATELQAMLNTIPFDLTFVDRDDTVRYFTQGQERIFDRNRAILGRKVQFCHPPHSVATVERILAAFKAGQQDAAAFWLTLKGRFIHIEYFALRDRGGAYLGTLEVSQDLTAKRALQGDRRLLSWDEATGEAPAGVEGANHG